MQIEAYLYRPPGEGPFPALIYNHGSRPGLEREERPMVHIAQAFVPAGYVVLVIERRGYGKSGGATFSQEVGRDRGAKYVNRLLAEADDVGAGALWGVQAGFGGAAPLQPWLAGAGGIALLALALNTGAALPIYWSLVFGSGRRLDRLREAWSGYWALFRGLVIPACGLFGLVVFRLLAAG